MIFSQGMKKETSSEPVWPDSSKQCCQNINIVESGWLIKIKMFVKLGDHYLVFPYSQCDQIWLFWKYLENKFTQKVVQTLGNFLCFLKALIQSKNCCVALLGNFWNNWATLYFNIWSHWRARGKSSAPKNTRSQKSRHASFVIQMYFLSGLSLLLTFNNSA